MKLLFDFFPIVLFFISYKLLGLYPATAIAMIASVFLLVFHRIKYQRYEKMQLLSVVVILVLGSATLFFHNPWFIKWKPTGIYWITALAFYGSSFIGKKPIIQKMMEANISLPNHIWHRLTLTWTFFFLLMGCLNLLVAYYFSLDTWVNFKLFGGIGLTLLFVIIQALYLAKHANESVLTKPLK